MIYIFAALVVLIGMAGWIISRTYTIMSKITEWAAKEATALASIQTGIANLDALIQQFQNSPGTLSAEDQAALDAISETSTSLAEAANKIPSPVPVPAPEV